MNQVAQQIISQLGGINRLAAMIAINRIAYSDNSVKFMFKGSRKANLVQITLDASDTYTMKFYRIRGEIKPVNELNGLFNNQLKSVFENETGLRLSL